MSTSLSGVYKKRKKLGIEKDSISKGHRVVSEEEIQDQFVRESSDDHDAQSSSAAQSTAAQSTAAQSLDDAQSPAAQSPDDAQSSAAQSLNGTLMINGMSTSLSGVYNDSDKKRFQGRLQVNGRYFSRVIGCLLQT